MAHAETPRRRQNANSESMERRPRRRTTVFPPLPPTQFTNEKVALLQGRERTHHGGAPRRTRRSIRRGHKEHRRNNNLRLNDRRLTHCVGRRGLRVKRHRSRGGGEEGREPTDQRRACRLRSTANNERLEGAHPDGQGEEGNSGGRDHRQDT